MGLKLIYLVASLDTLSFSMTITILTPYVLSLGGTQSFMGIMGSIGALITLIWNPILGSLSDRLGRKKVLLQCLAICFMGNFIITQFATLPALLISRVITAFGAQIMTLIISTTDDLFNNQDEKMGAINKIRALGGFCFIFGCLISGYLSENERGYQYVFYLISGMFLINFALIYFGVADKEPTKDQKAEASFNIINEVKLATKNLFNINWSRYWDLFTIKLIIDFSLMVFNFNVSFILTKRFGITGAQYGYVFAFMSVIGIIVNLIMLKIKDNFYKEVKSELRPLSHGIIALIITFVGIVASSNYVIFLICSIPLGIARVLSESTVTELLLSRASPQEKGSIMGTFDNTVALGGLFAPLISGLITDTWGENMSLISCLFPLILGTIITYYPKVKVQ